jgi:hypothetical protein
MGCSLVSDPGMFSGDVGHKRDLRIRPDIIFIVHLVLLHHTWLTHIGSVLIGSRRGWKVGGGSTAVDDSVAFAGEEPPT